jgi:DNA-binding CsgD family transcriptional regulator/tetratricopeptide (TPR) repeat protein
MNASTAFIGRSRELAAVRGLLDRVREGRAGGLFVVGEPGVGKSRLLLEAERLAGEEGVRVARAGCLPLTTPLPLDPVLDMLRSLGLPIGARLRGSPREMFWTVLEQLEQASVSGPVLLCLDDVQWSDAGTIDLVHYCLARFRDLPIAWLLAGRFGRLQLRVIHRLEREGLLERASLETLNAGETRELAEALLGQQAVTDEIARVLYARTGGNVFLCLELLRALSSAETDVLVASDAENGAIARLVPASVSDAIEERVERLAPSARAALEWAAVLPEPFTFGELVTVAGHVAGSAPEVLADAGFLIRGEDGCWRFLHSLIRDAVYGRLAEAERVRRHGIVADALAGGPPERVAPQLEHARRWREAADAYVRLGQSALASGHGEDAARLFGQAERLADADRDEALMRTALAGRVLALVHAGATDQARQLAGVLRSQLRAKADPDEYLGFLGRYATTLLLVHDATDVDTAREVLAEAEPLMAHAEPRVVADVLTARAWVSLRLGNVTEALPDAEAAAELVHDGDDPAQQARVLNSLGLAVGMGRSAAEGSAILERAAIHARDADVPAEAVRAYTNLSFMDGLAGDLRTELVHIRLGLAVEGGPAAITALLHSNLGWVEAQLGHLDTALAHELAAMRIAARGGPVTRARVACALAFVHLWRGELPAVHRLIDAYKLDSGSATDMRASELWGRVLEDEDEYAAALKRYELGAQLDDPIAINCELGAARTAVALGDLPRARAALGRMREQATRWPAGEAMHEEAQAWVALADGRHGDALAHFQAAASQSAGAYDSGRLRLQAAFLARDREAVKDTIDTLERMGAMHAADRGRAVARDLGIRVGRRKAAAGALTPREQEVAQLVAAGQTNAEIATSLYLSPRTVEHHISNILTKLGYRSRVQIAADAAAGRLSGAQTEPTSEATDEVNPD